MLRVIREVQPSWVVGENVLGLVNWSGGLVFHEVQTDLEAEGYEVFPFVLPACAVNAPHRRDRVWFVAYSKSKGTWEQSSKNRRGKNRRFDNDGKVWDAADTNGNGFNECNGHHEINTSEGGEYAFGNANKGNGDGIATNTNSRGLEGSTEVGWDSEYAIGKDGTTAQTRNVANTDSAGWQQSDQEMEGGSSEQSHSSRFQQDDANTSSQGLQGSKLNGSFGSQGKAKAYGGQFSGSICNQWEEFPTQPPICFGDDGLSARLDGITFPKWRNESIKAAGNAIVPQIAVMIFKSIAEYESLQPG